MTADWLMDLANTIWIRFADSVSARLSETVKLGTCAVVLHDCRLDQSNFRSRDVTTWPLCVSLSLSLSLSLYLSLSSVVLAHSV